MLARRTASRAGPLREHARWQRVVVGLQTIARGILARDPPNRPDPAESSLPLRRRLEAVSEPQSALDKRSPSRSSAGTVRSSEIPFQHVTAGDEPRLVSGQTTYPRECHLPGSARARSHTL